MIERTMDAMQKCGKGEIVVVRGYKKDKINLSNMKYYDNPNYLVSNVLTSLFYAEDEMKDGFIDSYSEILYDQ